MTTLSEIDDQDASTLICDFMICARCGIVDRERSRIRADSLCPACGQRAGVARLYYPVSIHILVDLVQESYHSYARVGPISGPQTSTIGPILFFCTLREALINHLLLENLRAEGTKQSLIERLLDDNKLAHQKFGALFRAVVGTSWADGVREASLYDGTDYQAVSNLMKLTASIRNDFLHDGAGWSASRELATECVDRLPQLFDLFVALHNVYIHPLLTAQH